MCIVCAIPFVITGCFVALAVLERWFPARPQLRVRGWTATGIVAFLVTSTLSATVPLLYADFIRAHRLLDLERLGTIGGAVVGLVVVDGINYWLHRARHARPLWRWHQMHHAAERLDVMGSAYFHPFDVMITNLMTSIGSTMVLGISPEAAAVLTMVAVGLGTFAHANIATPRWLGYVIARPEAHSVHHGRGIHARNYATLPLWDIVFGTFENPPRFEPAVGFYDGATSQLGALLVGADVARRTAASVASRSIRSKMPA